MNVNYAKMERRLSGFITYHFLMGGVLMLTGLPFLTSYSSIASIIAWSIYIIWFLSIIRIIKQRSWSVAINSYFISIFLYSISVCMSLLRGKPVDILLKHDALWTFVYFLPHGLAIYSLKDHLRLYEMLYKYSFIVTICGLAIFINHLINPLNTYDMSFGYILLMPTLIHFSYFLSHKRKVHILLIAIIETLMLLLYGSRGVFISIAVFILLYFFLIKKFKINKGGVFIGVVVFVFFFGYSVPKLLNDYLESQGLYSRTLSSFLDPETSSGREDYWGAGVTLITKKPLIGYGIGGYYYDFYEELIKRNPDEQYQFNTVLGEYVENRPNYGGCHNGILELMIYFGVIVGLPLGIWLVTSIFKAKLTNNYYLISLLIIFYSAYIAPSLVGSSGFNYKPECALYIFLILSLLKSSKSLKKDCIQKETLARI